ncbi:hypothetical protein [Paenibacillus planticolens]|uniref:Uncharacterized protein n=1 Tax=Paenibacillus planticolens TaxID=2654976 RepID=A0ABX1ZV75_9BACL|nr:hypothetical protein [Paenibacillus planticolens]NOV03902.1 hypothetical protein [Paenibacillus planticolens]
MTLLVNHVYGIVHRNVNGTITVFNGRVVSRGRTFIILRFMNNRGIVILRRLLLIRIIRFAAI